MSARRAALAAGMVLALTVPARGRGRSRQGRQASRDDCLGCHGTELYVPPRAKVKTVSALKKETEKWNDRMNPKFTKQEIEDLVAYLNANFYKFPN